MSSEERSKAFGEQRAAWVPKGPYNCTPLFASQAKGAVIVDINGREYIDFAGGIGVMNVGHCHPRVVAAVREQAGRFTHTCFHVVMYEWYHRLAERLAGLTPGRFEKMGLWMNSGAEAVENAVKVARYATGRAGIICLDHAFHGRTLLGLSLTAKAMPYKRGFGPFAPEVYRLPAPYCYRCPLNLTYPECGTACAGLLERLLETQLAPEDAAAFLAEPVLGEGGFITPPLDYFQKAEEICRRHGVLFIADEIQSGFGRTGKMFAMEHFGAVPDLVTVGKSIAGGLPLSGVVGRRDVLDAPHVGGLGATYGGNPISLRAALAVLDVFEEENLLARAEVLGRVMRKRFDSWAGLYEIIGEVRGIGPMLGLELVKDRLSREPDAEAAKAVAARCLDKGLIVLTCGTYGNVIRILVPLVIEEELLARGLEVLEEAVSQALTSMNRKTGKGGAV